MDRRSALKNAGIAGVLAAGHRADRTPDPCADARSPAMAGSASDVRQ